jgi:hypothetical protein
MSNGMFLVCSLPLQPSLSTIRCVKENDTTDEIDEADIVLIIHVAYLDSLTTLRPAAVASAFLN